MIITIDGIFDVEELTQTLNSSNKFTSFGFNTEYLTLPEIDKREYSIYEMKKIFSDEMSNIFNIDDNNFHKIVTNSWLTKMVKTPIYDGYSSGYLLEHITNRTKVLSIVVLPDKPRISVKSDEFSYNVLDSDVIREWDNYHSVFDIIDNEKLMIKYKDTDNMTKIVNKIINFIMIEYRGY